MKDWDEVFPLSNGILHNADKREISQALGIKNNYTQMIRSHKNLRTFSEKFYGIEKETLDGGKLDEETVHKLIDVLSDR